MPASFEAAFLFMIPHEDFHWNDPVKGGIIGNEPAGGVAKYGINSKAWPNVDVPNLTLEGAEAIYRVHFWDFGGFELLDNQDVANKLFDMTVNLGINGAFCLAAFALFTLGTHNVVDTFPMDFWAGQVMPSSYFPKMIEAVNTVPSYKLLVALRAAQAEHYRMVAKAKPAAVDWLKNWLWRASV